MTEENKQNEDVAYKKIFTRRLAIWLQDEGHKLVKTEKNYKHPEFDVYVFEDSDELREKMCEYSALKEAGNFLD